MTRRRAAVVTRRRAALACGSVVLVVAVSPPVTRLAHELFSWHMTQHLAIVIVAAPLLAWGLPWTARIRSPVAAPIAFAVVLWGWHLPSAYTAALLHDPLHAVEHLSLLAAAVVFWAPVVNGVLPRGVAMLTLFATFLQSGLLGAVLTFAGTVLYPVHTGGRGLTPLQDQQLAGALMWVPPGIVYIACIAVVFRRWLAVGTGVLVMAGCTYGRPEPRPYRPPLPDVVAGPDRGRLLYARDCAWCHGDDGRGTTHGVDLVTGANGPALTDLMLRSGRMPLRSPTDTMVRSPSVYTDEEIADIVAYVSTFGATGPGVPDVDPRRGDHGGGLELYQEHCSACHAPTGAGGVLVQRRRSGGVVPGFERSSALEIAEAIRTGPGTMPVFGESAIRPDELDAVVSYVLYLQVPDDRGGASLGRVGPVSEGAVGWIAGLGLLLVFSRWIGTRVGED